MAEWQSIILIGPMSAGKSTVAALLADALGMERVEVDEIRWDYFREIGYDDARVKAMMEGGGGYPEMLSYWKPFEVHALERTLEDHRNCILDFGAGYTVQEDRALFARVEKALAAYEQVLLLLPSADPDRSVEILNQRFSELLLREVGEVRPEVLEINAHFVKHPTNRQLATAVFYTENKSPQQSCQEIVTHIGAT